MSRYGAILVVDDEPVMRDSLAAWLREDGYAVETAASGLEAVEKAGRSAFLACFVDLKLPPGMNGIEAMRAIRQLQPETAVVIITAFASVDTAITAMKEGAHDYIVKPCNPEEISLMLRRLLQLRDLERENLLLRQRLSRQYTFQDIISKNPKMHEIFQLIRQIASLKSTVLVHGESGTGKELIARAIHDSGERAAKAFVPVSCGALTETLLESELFGYEKGAFTGAASQKKGKFELADGGTLFLDEIGDISAKLQVDLLRVLQERCFFRVGGTDEISVDVRIIAATNQQLEEAVRQGRFRGDLFYRLNVINIRIPPLRERREDIPLLARHFLRRICVELDKEIADFSDGALRVLMDHDWPGNVRELENTVERAVVTCEKGVLAAADLSFLTIHARGGAAWVPPSDLPLREVEKQVIEATLARTRGNVKKAAAVLGIDRSTLYDKLRKYEIRRQEPR
jgi:DNA-binding NtrC family response regulator